MFNIPIYINTDNAFLNSMACLTTGPCLLPQRAPSRERSSASSFNLQYPLISLRSSSSCLQLFLPLFNTSILPSIFPSVTHFTRQYLRQMWPIQLVFFRFILCSKFLSSFILCNTSLLHTRSIQMLLSTLPQHHISKLPTYFWSDFRSVQVSALFEALLRM